MLPPESCPQTYVTYNIAEFTVNKLLLEGCPQIYVTYNIAECTVNKLLMMDRGTVRNMWSFMSK